MAPVHVVFAPDCFSGTLTAQQAAEAMAKGWREVAADDLITLMPLSDGGPGFVDVLENALPEAEALFVTVADPLGREVPAAVLVVDRDGVRTAYIESAQAAGLHLLAADERNPAVKKMIAQVIATCSTRGRKIGICGQAPSDYPEFAQFLVEQGIDSISLNPDTVLKTTQAIMQQELA